MFDLERELDQLRDALASKDIPYALCGGLAMAVHGSPRSTVDIDLFIRPEDYERVERVARGLRFNIVAMPMIFSSGRMQIRRISKIHPDDGEVLMLDLLLVTPSTEQVWATREKMTWRDRELYVVSKPGLIALKTFRSSAQDLADIEKLQTPS